MQASACAGQPAAPGSAPTPGALESGQGVSWVDWPIIVHRRKVSPKKYLFVRSDGQLVCLDLCPVDCRCPRYAQREPPCLITSEAYEFVVPTVFSPNWWEWESLPRRIFKSWEEAARLAHSLASSYVEECNARCAAT